MPGYSLETHSTEDGLVPSPGVARRLCLAPKKAEKVSTRPDLSKAGPLGGQDGVVTGNISPGLNQSAGVTWQ